jgi:hypothetical protein
MLRAPLSPQLARHRSHRRNSQVCYKTYGDQGLTYQARPRIRASTVQSSMVTSPPADIPNLLGLPMRLGESGQTDPCALTLRLLQTSLADGRLLFAIPFHGDMGRRSLTPGPDCAS